MLNWTLRVLGEPCGSGQAESQDECRRQAKEVLRNRQDYQAILTLGMPVLVTLEIKETES